MSERIEFNIRIRAREPMTDAVMGTLQAAFVDDGKVRQQYDPVKLTFRWDYDSKTHDYTDRTCIDGHGSLHLNTNEYSEKYEQFEPVAAEIARRVHQVSGQHYQVSFDVRYPDRIPSESYWFFGEQDAEKVTAILKNTGRYRGDVGWVLNPVEGTLYCSQCDQLTVGFADPCLECVEWNAEQAAKAKAEAER